jgi:rhodanese-related sulfurtransferase
MRISAQELKNKIENCDDFQLIDLREKYEFDDFNIGGINIPMDEVLKNIKKLSLTKPIVFYCNEGLKSRALIIVLKRKLNNPQLYSLEGGIIAYYEAFEV